MELIRAKHFRQNQSISMLILMIIIFLIPSYISKGEPGSKSKVPSSSPTLKTKEKTTGQKSKIHFCWYKTMRFGKANLYCNGIHLHKLAKRSALTLIIEPGKHKLQTDLNKEGLLLTAQPLKEYYIDITPNFFWGGFNIKEIDISEIKPIIDKMPKEKKKELDFNQIKSKPPKKTFFSEAFKNYMRYSTLASAIIAFLIYIGMIMVSPQGDSDEVLYIAFMFFIIILCILAICYHPVTFLAKIGWKFLSALFREHIWVGLLFFCDVFLNIWLGILINDARDLSGAYEDSTTGYWATQDGQRYMSAKKWQTGEWIAPMKALPKLILWNVFIIILSLVSVVKFQYQYPPEIRFLIAYSALLLLLWLFYLFTRKKTY